MNRIGLWGLHILTLWASSPSLPAEDLPVFEAVHVIFAEEHSHNLVSGFGHIFVCLPKTKITGVGDLLGEVALSFGADIGPLGRGMWIGEYMLQPCHELFRANSHFDQRRLTIFELDIPKEQLEQLRRELKGRLGKTYPYEFTRYNCGHYIWDWLRGSQESSPAYLYFTPREALERILSVFPPVNILSVPSDLEVLEDCLLGSRQPISNSVRAALSDPSALAQVSDLETRLLAITLAESRADREEYVRLQELRTTTLAEPGGGAAARQAIARWERLTEHPTSTWPEEREGPAVAASLAHYPEEGVTGLRFFMEAGLRDAFSDPVPTHLWRETRFLSLTVEQTEGASRVDFLLASFSALRDARSLLAGASNGLSAGYRDLPNARGVSGLFLSSWSGLSTETDMGWVGARLSFAADELHDKASLQLSPGLTWDLLRANHAAHVELHHSWDRGPGWLVRHDWISGRSTVFRTDWTHAPDGIDVLSAGFRIRF